MNRTISILLLLFLCGAYRLGASQDINFKLENFAVSSLPNEIVAPDLKSITIDLKGNVFAFSGKSNSKGCCIIKFDSNLKYLKHFGRDGYGPGEFSTLNSSPLDRISIDEKGNIYVIDYNPSRRLVVFDNDGNYREDISIERNYIAALGHIFRVKSVGNGTFIALQYRENLPYAGLIFTLEPTHILVKYPFIEKSRYKMIYSTSHYGPYTFITTNNQYIAMAHSQCYKFMVYDTKGKKIVAVEDKARNIGNFTDIEMKMIIDTDLAPTADKTTEQKQSMTDLRKNKSHFNKVVEDIRTHKNVIANIMIDGEKILVFPVRKNITDTNHYPLEIYNFKGQKIQSGYLEKMPDQIRNDYAYFTERNTNDDPLIIKQNIVYK